MLTAIGSDLKGLYDMGKGDDMDLIPQVLSEFLQFSLTELINPFARFMSPIPIPDPRHSRGIYDRIKLQRL